MHTVNLTFTENAVYNGYYKSSFLEICYLTRLSGFAASKWDNAVACSYCLSFPGGASMSLTQWHKEVHLFPTKSRFYCGG